MAQTSKEFAEVARHQQQRLNVDREVWNEYLFAIGCSFAEHWYESNALYVMSKTNFWDLWTVEFIRDDEILIRKFLDVIVDSETGTQLEKYYRYKHAMIQDKTLYRNIDNFLRDEPTKQ